MTNYLEGQRKRRDQRSRGHEIDKPYHYGEFYEGEDRSHQRRNWMDRLWRKVTHKAMDIADEGDEMNNIQANRYGISWKEITVVGALLLVFWMGPRFLDHYFPKGETVEEKESQQGQDTRVRLRFRETSDE